MQKMTSTSRILIADDQADVLKALRLLLRPEGYEMTTASSVEEIVDSVNRNDFDVVLMDLNYIRGETSGRQGLDLLERIHQTDESLPVVVMTAWSSVELAVEAMRRGARDFIQKPWKNERLLSVLQTQVDLGRALRESRKLSQEIDYLTTKSRRILIAESAAMQPVLETIAKVGPSVWRSIGTRETLARPHRPWVSAGRRCIDGLKNIKSNKMRFERKITVLSLLSGLAGVLLALILLWTQPSQRSTQWILTFLILMCWVGFALSVRNKVAFPLRTILNLIGALREGDYSMRLRGARRDDAMGELAWEVNRLVQLLQGQRFNVVESTALLQCRRSWRKSTWPFSDLTQAVFYSGSMIAADNCSSKTMKK